jgi:L-alanine-DL-glutamate epimerase-like enolase superfamily enzyme
MQITSIETFVQGQKLGLVRVTAEDGSTGWGQMAPSNADITALVLHRQIGPIALGWDVADLDGLNDAVIEGTYKFPGTYVCRALAGIDTALWDLRGRQQGKSVCELLGGRNRPFPVYGSSTSRKITPADEAARMVRLRDEKGFRAFKMKIGKRGGHDADEWPGRSESIILATRKTLGPEIALMADANSCYTPARAIEIGRLLEDQGFAHFEEPCPYWELEWTAEVAAALAIPVAGGEQDYDLKQWERLIHGGVVDIAQPDLCYVGGMTRALRVAKLAEEAGLPVVPHSANHSFTTICALHLMGAIPNAGPYVEFSIEDQSAFADLYRPQLQVIDGHVQIPDGPGWGVEINPAWLEQAERVVSDGE